MSLSRIWANITPKTRALLRRGDAAVAERVLGSALREGWPDLAEADLLGFAQLAARVTQAPVAFHVAAARACVSRDTWRVRLRNISQGQGFAGLERMARMASSFDVEELADAAEALVLAERGEQGPLRRLYELFAPAWEEEHAGHERRLLTTAQVGGLLGISRSAVLKHVERGNIIPDERLEGAHRTKYLFTPQAVEAFRKKRRQPGRPPGQPAE